MDPTRFCRLYFKCDDILEYFTHANSLGLLPSYEDLEQIARKLFDTYTSAAAQYEAADDARNGSSPWAADVPLGTTWNPPLVDDTSVSTAQASKKKAKRAPDPIKDDTVQFHGDQSLSRSIGFMRAAAISREVAAATTQGEIGRVWEGLKVRNALYKISVSNRQ